MKRNITLYLQIDLIKKIKNKGLSVSPLINKLMQEYIEAGLLKANTKYDIEKNIQKLAKKNTQNNIKIYELEQKLAKIHKKIGENPKKTPKNRKKISRSKIVHVIK